MCFSVQMQSMCVAVKGGLTETKKKCVKVASGNISHPVSRPDAQPRPSLRLLPPPRHRRSSFATSQNTTTTTTTTIIIYYLNHMKRHVRLYLYIFLFCNNTVHIQHTTPNCYKNLQNFDQRTYNDQFLQYSNIVNRGRYDALYRSVSEMKIVSRITDTRQALYYQVDEKVLSYFTIF